MSENIKKFYRDILDKQKTVALDCIDNEIRFQKFTQAHNFLIDIEKYTYIVSFRPEIVCVQSAMREYQYALSAVVTGQYRHAFSSLRLSLELLMSTIHFSGYEFHLRQWQDAHRDIKWQSLIDPDSGVFSAQFVRAFHPTLGEIRKKYSGLVAITYRECSEFVHGNPKQNRLLEGELEFRENAFNKWCDTVENIQLIVTYLFLYRYIEIMDANKSKLLEELSLNNLWHEEQVRACFGNE